MEMSRILPIKSAYNFRDLGGYKTSDGRRVKWRKLLRSSDFAKLSDEDKLFLEGLQLRHVIDLRSQPEVELLKDDVPQNVEVHNLYIDAGNLVPKFKKLMEDSELSENERFEEGMKLMKEMYRRLASDYSELFRKFFKIMQSDDSAKLFHCTAGKDRTGVSAALLLSALGVDRKTIYEDYLITNKALAGKYDDLMVYGKIASLFANVHEEFLDTFFNTIEEKFCSVEKYLTDELLVNLTTLKNLYLEDELD